MSTVGGNDVSAGLTLQASAVNRQVALNVVDVMMRGATLDRGLELMRSELADARAAGDALFEVTVGLRRVLDARVGSAPTVWWLELLEGSNIEGLTQRELISLLDRVELAARGHGSLVGLHRTDRPSIAALIQVATVHAVLYSVQHRYEHEFGPESLGPSLA